MTMNKEEAVWGKKGNVQNAATSTTEGRFMFTNQQEN